MAESIQNQTLRERLTEAERLTRELADHVNQGFLPKLSELRRVVKHQEGRPSQDEATDTTVRTYADGVFESDDFTQQLYDKLAAYLNSIDSEVRRMVYGD